MRMSISMLVITLVAILVIAIVWYSTNQGRNMVGTTAHQRITPQAYQTSLAARKHMLIDVRTAEEFRSGHIPDATNIALPDLPQRMATLPKDQPLVVYCRSGARSKSAAQMLTRAGFENVHDLGGIMDWQAQGLPVN